MRNSDMGPGAGRPGRNKPGAHHLLTGLSWLSVTAVSTCVVAFLAFLVRGGARGLGPGFLFGGVAPLDAVLRGYPVFDGIWPSLLGTLQLVAGASVLAIPVGVLAGIHLARQGDSPAATVLRTAVDVLAGIPSIIMGLFGFGMILFLRHGPLPGANTGLLPAMICLALLVLPYLVRTTETALHGLPEQLRLAGPSLGMSEEQSLRRILLPAAGPGILGGVLLAVGRVAEDTAVILMTGVVANSGRAGSLTGKFQALPFDIYFLAAEHRGPADLHRAFATAIILLVLTGLLFLGARTLQARWERKRGWR